MSELDNNQSDNIPSADDQVDAIAAALDVGDRAKAVELNNILWSSGGTLSQDYKNFYIECLLDMGEIEQAASLLKPIMNNLTIYVGDYWPVLLKYAFLSANLSLAVSIGEYPDIHQQMEPIFNWLQTHQQDYTLRHFNYILHMATEAMRGKLCAFDLLVLDDGKIECVFYSTDDDEQNRQTAADIIEKSTEYLNNLEITLPEDWILAFDNVANRDLSL